LLIGQRIRQRRMEIDISQHALGKHLGVSFQQVQKYEKGVNRVSAVRLIEIAKFLNVETEYFIGDMHKKKRSNGELQTSAFMATKEGVQIIAAMIAIKTPELRQSVIEIARKLAGAEGHVAD
jgi:transcriptional regulator with XRE-family HTH domain